MPSPTAYWPIPTSPPLWPTPSPSWEHVSRCVPNMKECRGLYSSWSITAKRYERVGAGMERATG